MCPDEGLADAYAEEASYLSVKKQKNKINSQKWKQKPGKIEHFSVLPLGRQKQEVHGNACTEGERSKMGTKR